jgi:peptide/nickel transport system substrate-binding protein
MRRSTIQALLCAGAWIGQIACAASPLWAKDLRIALSTEPSSIDPHFHVTTPNMALSTHLFDRLVHADEKQQLIPGLATSWKSLDPLTWEFKLRQGVTWHDGAPFTADDVVFSLGRAVDVPNSPSGFGIYLRGKTVSKVDDHTIRIATTTPYPLMANDMSTIAIVSHVHGKGATTADYNSGKAAIGTGPYKFASFTPGDKIEFIANPAYWGEKPRWDKVTLKPIRSGPARVAALLAGDADLIEDVPTVDVAKLKTDARVAMAQSPSYRVVFLQTDQWRETTPFANAKDGSAIKNPFRNVKVRRALAHAINTDALVSRIMEGNAQVAAQLLPDGFFGVSANAKPVPFDGEKARKLLTEAGFPNGFRITMHGPAGRYPNDMRILEAIAQMLTRVGIEATIETMPPAQFFSRASTGADGQPEFSLFLSGWGAATGENSSPLKGLLATFDKQKGLGSSNRGRYASKAFDDALEQALTTIDRDAVKAGLAKATDIALADAALLPLLHPLNTWAARKGIVFRARTDEATTAMSAADE